jgi:Tfp pilus assembly protein PilF
MLGIEPPWLTGRCLTNLASFLLAAFLSLPVASSATADPGSRGQIQFQAGVRAARENNFRQAIDLFLQAWAAGIQTAAVQYNLGVSYYKTNQYKLARRAFLKAAEWPDMASPGYYNLGLIALRQNDPQQARHWFTRAFRSARTDTLRNLSQTELNKLDIVAASHERWMVWTEIGVEYDDNVLLIPDQSESASNREDSSYNLTLYGHYQFNNAKQQQGLRWHGLMATQRYTEWDGFDYTFFETGLSYPFKKQRWQARPGVSIRSSELGGDPYQDSSVASLQVGYTHGSDWLIRTDLQLESIDARDTFIFLDGDKSAVKFTLYNKSGWLLRYERESNDRRDLIYIDDQNGTDSEEFYSFSPNRQRLEMEYPFQLRPSLKLIVGAANRQSLYRDADRRSDGTIKKREDGLWQLHLGLESGFYSGWRISANIYVIDNDSNFDEFSYRRATFNLALDKEFKGF